MSCAFHDIKSAIFYIYGLTRDIMIIYFQAMKVFICMDKEVFMMSYCKKKKKVWNYTYAGILATSVSDDLSESRGFFEADN